MENYVWSVVSFKPETIHSCGFRFDVRKRQNGDMTSLFFRWRHIRRFFEKHTSAKLIFVTIGKIVRYEEKSVKKNRIYSDIFDGDLTE